MMKLERKDKSITTFEELSIGDVYKDEDGYICIKTKEGDGDNSLTYEWAGVGGWSTTSETSIAEVTPMKATLTVED